MEVFLKSPSSFSSSSSSSSETTPPASATSTASTATASPALLGTGLVYYDSAVSQALAVQLGYGILCLLVTRHLNKTESPGLSGISVRNYIHGLYLPHCTKTTL